MSKQEVTMEAVFRLKPNRTDTEMGECDIKLAGYVSPTDKLGDEQIDIETSEKEIRTVGKNTLLLKNINGFDITVNAYRNNIIGNYLIKHKDLPVCSLQMMYAKNIVVGYLFNIFIYFSLDSAKNHFLKTPKDYVGARIYGKYYMCIDCDPELMDYMNNLSDEEIEKLSLEDIAERLAGTGENLSEPELLQMIQQDVAEKKAFYKTLLTSTEVHYTKNIKKMAEQYLFPVFRNTHINGLIKVALNERAKKRVKEYGAFDGEYKIPEKVLNINDVKNNPDVVDKFINDSDEELN